MSHDSENKKGIQHPASPFFLFYANTSDLETRFFLPPPPPRRSATQQSGEHFWTELLHIYCDTTARVKGGLIMSRGASFVVGLVVSGVGYTYLSNELVKSRNQLISQHFKAEGVELYDPSAETKRKVRSTVIT